MTFPYDPIRHLAMALHFDQWREAEFAVLTVYGDAGGSAHQPNEAAQIVGGFLGNAELWIEFTVEWNEFLERHDLPALHMNELSTDPAIRKPILDEAIQVITKRDYDLRLFIVAVDSADFLAYQAIHGDDPARSLGPFKHSYPFAVWTHVSLVSGSCELNNWKEPNQWIYEAGDPYQAEIKRELRKKNYADPIFKTKRERIRPLEACDFLSSEVLQAYRDGAAFDEHRIAKRPVTGTVSPYVEEFRKMKGDMGVYTSDNLPRLRDAVDAELRLLAAADEGREVRRRDEATKATPEK